MVGSSCSRGQHLGALGDLSVQARAEFPVLSLPALCRPPPSTPAAGGALGAPHAVPHRGDGRAADAAGSGAAAATLPPGPGAALLRCMQRSASMPRLLVAVLLGPHVPPLWHLPCSLLVPTAQRFKSTHPLRLPQTRPQAGVPAHHSVQEPRRGAAAGSPGEHCGLHGTQGAAHAQRAAAGRRPHRLAPAPGPVQGGQLCTEAGRERGRADAGHAAVASGAAIGSGWQRQRQAQRPAPAAAVC